MLANIRRVVGACQRGLRKQREGIAEHGWGMLPLARRAKLAHRRRRLRHRLPAIMDAMKLFWCAAFAAAALSAQTFPGAAALDEAIEQGRMPGAVLLVGHEGQVVYRKAYGKRALVPQPEAMTLDTIFDCASLTKVVATTSSLMKLFQEGRFRLNDRITDYIPEFQGGKSE